MTDTMTDPPTDTGRTVSRRVFALLGAFTPQHPALRLVDLHRATGLPVSTVHRVAAELVEQGALTKTDGVYRIGLRLWELGSLAPQPRTLREVSLPFMQDLYEATAENVYLAVLDRGEVLYVERVWGHRSVDVHLQVGERSALHATGVGRVLLSHAPREFQEAVVRAGLRRFTPHTVVMPGLVMRTLEDVRRSGIARCVEQRSLGVISLAVPVFDGAERVVAALSVVMRTHTRSLATVEPSLRMAGRSISRELAKGYSAVGVERQVTARAR